MFKYVLPKLNLQNNPPNNISIYHDKIRLFSARLFMNNKQGAVSKVQLFSLEHCGLPDSHYYADVRCRFKILMIKFCVNFENSSCQTKAVLTEF